MIRRERNRLHAKRTRLRKKKMLQVTETMISTLENDVQSLRQTVFQNASCSRLNVSAPRMTSMPPAISTGYHSSTPTTYEEFTAAAAAVVGSKTGYKSFQLGLRGSSVTTSSSSGTRGGTSKESGSSRSVCSDSSTDSVSLGEDLCDAQTTGIRRETNNSMEAGRVQNNVNTFHYQHQDFPIYVGQV